MGKNKSKSGDPRRRAEQASAPPQPTPQQPTPVSEWIGANDTGVEVVLLPSGNSARVRRSGPEAFMAQGIVPDPLTAIVEKSIASKKGLKPAEQVAIAKDPEKLGALVEMLDRTVCYAVVEPKVVMPPDCTECGELDTARAKQHSDETRDDYHEFKEGERVEGVLYADRVALDDKNFIMQYTLGGTRDLERFRRQHGRTLASLSTV